MPYSINKFDGTTVTVVEDGTLNSTLDIKLFGRDYPGYGEIQNENFVFMLENFAGTTPPPRPLNGQIWYDTSAKRIKYYEQVSQTWRSSGGTEVSATPPVGLALGDLWWDSTELKLYVKGAYGFTLIGPQSVYNFGQTQLKSRGVIDEFNTTHAVIETWTDGQIVNVIASDAFTLHSSIITEYSGRLTYIKKGLNLAFTDDNGVSTVSDTRYWGTSSDADRLGGHLASDYLLASGAHFQDAGYFLGNDNDLHVYMSGTNADISTHYPIIENTVSNKIGFTVRDNATAVTPLLINGSEVIPGITNSVNLGSSTYTFNTVYANNVIGTASAADSLKVLTSTTSIYSVATTGPTINSIAARDSDGNLSANIFNGVATSARFADLAEKYIPDADYEVGTVVVIGGEKEITASNWVGQRAIGVISGNPAFMMNSELEDGVYVALKGRVPVRVHGPIGKGDRLMASTIGAASRCNEFYENTFAIALESSDVSGIVTIEAVIL